MADAKQVINTEHEQYHEDMMRIILNNKIG